MKQILLRKIAISLLIIGYYLGGASDLPAQQKSRSTSKPEIIFLCDSTRESFSLTVIDNKYYFHTQEKKVTSIINLDEVDAMSIETKASERMKRDPLIMKYNEKITDPIMIVKTKK